MKAIGLSMIIGLLVGSAACAGVITYDAVLSGASEVPANASPGIGFATVTVDTIAETMEVDMTFSGLLGTSTASHIHCCTATPLAGNAGVATVTPTFTGFPLGVTSGAYDNTFDLTAAGSYNPAFVTAQGGVANAEAALLAGIAGGEAYVNIHTTVFPGGEIRGYLVEAPASAPEPATFVLAGIALAGLFIRKSSGLRGR